MVQTILACRLDTLSMVDKRYPVLDTRSQCTILDTTLATCVALMETRPQACWERMAILIDKT